MNIMNNEKISAAHVLADEIYNALRNIRLACKMSGDTTLEVIEEEDVASADIVDLRIAYMELSWRVDIIKDYIRNVEEKLHELDTMAQAKLQPENGAVKEKADADDLLFSLLHDAAETGKVSSKKLVALMQAREFERHKEDEVIRMRAKTTVSTKSSQ